MISKAVQDKFLIIITGPTASGKTGLAIRIAEKLDTEIINADSRQVFREMVIGTAAPDARQRSQIKHHLMGHKSVTDRYNASIFEFEVLELLEKLFLRRQLVIMTGGSGLYIDAVCRGINDLPPVDPAVREELKALYRKDGMAGITKELEKADPEYYKRVDLKNPKRILKALEIYITTGKPYSTYLTGRRKPRPFNIIKIGLEIDRRILYGRINRRVDEMVSCGLVDEVRSLYPYRDRNALNTPGYKEIFEYLEENISLEEAIDLIKRHTRQYARRQLTWFRKDQEIRWFSPDNPTEIFNFISTVTGQHFLN
ncbi:MAG: tRNA (adenosine(37)-N6)-dimethylallyltransferase MiaA [Bacteroidales bacterium]|nr:tRNA (adenosine(37)-N6)-dimethylallyltransferase MiaA [Bacteroidales bacterium]